MQNGEEFLEPIQKIFEKIEKKLSDREIFQNLFDKIENSKLQNSTDLGMKPVPRNVTIVENKLTHYNINLDLPYKGKFEILFLINLKQKGGQR